MSLMVDTRSGFCLLALGAMANQFTASITKSTIKKMNKMKERKKNTTLIKKWMIKLMMIIKFMT